MLHLVLAVGSLSLGCPQYPGTVRTIAPLGDDMPWGWVDISADGERITFLSSAALVEQDTNGEPDIYLFDVRAETYELITTSGERKLQRDVELFAPTLSGNGRVVLYGAHVDAFEDEPRPRETSPGLGLPIPPDHALFLRDVGSKTTEQIACTPVVMAWDLSFDGRFVVFSAQQPLVAEDDNDLCDVYRYDRQTGEFALVSVGTKGAGNGSSNFGALSADGRFVVFRSTAWNLRADKGSDPLRPGAYRSQVLGPARQSQNVFVRDMANAFVLQLCWSTDAGIPRISADGRIVAYSSEDGNRREVVVHDLVDDTHNRVRKGSITNAVQLSADSQIITFFAERTHDRGDGSLWWERAAGRYDRRTGESSWAAPSYWETEGADTDIIGSVPAVSADGSRVVFHSNADVPGGKWEIRYWTSDAAEAAAGPGD